MIDNTITVTAIRRMTEQGFDVEVDTNIPGMADSLATKLCRIQVDLTDRVIREGLIELGWTPPEDDRSGTG